MNEKTCVVYHSRDLDGWMSAAIVKKWFEENFKNPHVYDLENISKEIFRSDANKLAMLGFDYGDKIPDLSEYDKVIMCDVGFPPDKMKELYTDLGINFIWIDHHISSIKSVEDALGSDLIEGLKNTKFAACELTWKYFYGNDPKSLKMPEIVRLLGRYDCFGHKGTDEEQKVLEFQYGSRAIMSNYEDCYIYLGIEIDNRNKTIYNQEANKGISDKGLSIYQYLRTEAKQTYAKSFPVFLKEFKDIQHPSLERKFLMVNQERFNPVNFGINYHKDGYDGFACFWFKDNQWNFSLYNDNEEVDCSTIAKQFNGGGHKGAAGMVLNHEQFMDLIK